MESLKSRFRDTHFSDKHGTNMWRVKSTAQETARRTSAERAEAQLAKPKRLGPQVHSGLNQLALNVMFLSIKRNAKN